MLPSGRNSPPSSPAPQLVGHGSYSPLWTVLPSPDATERKDVQEMGRPAVKNLLCISVDIHTAAALAAGSTCWLAELGLNSRAGAMLCLLCEAAILEALGLLPALPSCCIGEGGR